MNSRAGIQDGFASLPLMRAELHALVAATRAARQEARTLREASAEICRRLQREWSTISVQWGLTLRADPEAETREHRSALIDTLGAVGVGEDDLDDLIRSMCAAYEAARDRGDDEMLCILGDTLRAIGIYLAAQLGPKAAGVVLS